MNGKRLLLYAAVATALVGCQSLGPSGGKQVVKDTCTTPQCQIDVFVEGSPPALRVSVDELTVRGNQNVMMHWHLRNNDYEFRNDGIQFYDPASSGQFSGPGTEGSGSQFHFTNKNTQRGSWGYQVKVYNKRTGTWIPLDPAIYNDGG